MCFSLRIGFGQITAAMKSTRAFSAYTWINEIDCVVASAAEYCELAESKYQFVT